MNTNLLKKSLSMLVVVSFLLLATSSMATAAPVALETSASTAELIEITIDVYNEDGSINQETISVSTEIIDEIQTALMNGENPLDVLVEYGVITESFAETFGTTDRPHMNLTDIIGLLKKPMIWGFNADVMSLTLLGCSQSKESELFTKIVQFFDKDNTDPISLLEKSHGLLGYTQITKNEENNWMAGLWIHTTMIGYTGVHISAPKIFDYYSGHALLVFSFGMSLLGTATPIIPEAE